MPSKEEVRKLLPELDMIKDEDLREKVYSKVKTKDWALLELTRESKSLESIFSELTQEKEG